MALRLRQILFWIVLPAAAIALAFLFRAGIIAVCLYALVLLVVTARTMTVLWMRNLICERELSADVIEGGESIRVILKITNPGWWPILWLYAEETLPPGTPVDGTTRRLLFLPPRRSFYLHYQLTANRRGCHQIGPLVLESGDIFGLFKRCRVLPRRDFVTVLPHYVEIEEFEVGRVRRIGEMTVRRGLFEDPSRMAGVREYRRGDPLNHIHWRSSARMAELTGELVTRVFEPVSDQGATILLDLHRDAWTGLRPIQPELPAHEMAIRVACTFARYLADGGWKVGLFSNGRDPLGLPGVTMAQARATDSLSRAQSEAHRRAKDDRLEPISLRARRGHDQFMAIRENLGRVELSDGLPLESLIWDELPYFEREQVLAAVVGRASDSLISGLLRVRALDYRMLVLSVGDVESQDRLFEAMTPVGVEVLRIDEEWRLREIATGRRTI